MPGEDPWIRGGLVRNEPETPIREALVRAAGVWLRDVARRRFLGLSPSCLPSWRAPISSAGMAV